MKTETLHATASAPDTWSPPAEFDEYRIVRPLGRGGMGQVYLGHDTLLDRPVAIKFISRSDPDAVSRQRFLVEGRAIARLQHPCVVSVYRVGEVDQRPYLISEFVRGRSLEEIETPVAAAELTRIGVALARGLAAAHRRGVLHRDLKPANAMITTDDEVKLLDFGLAKLVEAPAAAGHDHTLPAGPPRAAPDPGQVRPAQDRAALPGRTLTLPPASPTPEGAGDAGLTGIGTVMGTPHYMAPEIWRGEPATTRSDVYSLGALLYKLATGRPPHVAPSLEELEQRVQRRSARPLAAAAAGIDPALGKIVDRCLAPDPAARYANADELRDALEQLTPAVRAAALPDGNPYRGLAPFEAEHRALYFGRGAEVRSVIDRLRAEPLIVVAGVSGAGKSSLLRAGVLPRVLEGALGDGRAWTMVTAIPGRSPLAVLAAALAPILEEDEAGLARRAAHEAPSLVRELRRRMGDRRGLLIFLDQLEELVTIADPAEARVVGELVGQACVVAGGVRVAATARSDFLGQLAALPGLGEQLVRGLHLLRPMTGEGIRDAIVGPARAKGVTFEDEEVIASLVADASQDPASLPLLQFALSELWDARDAERGVITRAAFEQTGGVAGALVEHADAVMQRLLPAQRPIARRILLRLVSSEGTRVRLPAAELDPAAAQDTVDALVRGRLVVTREGDAGVEYELTHEALIHGWSSLRAWIADDAGRGVIRQRLAKAAAEWRRLAQAPEALWRDLMLAEATQLDAAELTAAERSFLGASRAARRRRRWSRRALLAGLPAIAVSGYLGVECANRAELRRRAGDQIVESNRLLEQARASERAAAELRAKAFAGFDRGAWEAAEGDWAAARAAAAQVDRALYRASQALEAALKIDPASARVSARFADVLLERVLAAERDHRGAQLEELRERLALYDAGGERRRRLDAPARLAIASSPGAKVRIERLAADARGHRRVAWARDLEAPPPGELELPPGSYVLAFAAPRRTEVRLPIVLARAERHEVAVELPPAAAIPDGYVYIPAGRFLVGSADEGMRAGFLNTVPLHEARTGPFLIARHETTYADWIAFLQALPDDERRRRAPRVAEQGFHGAMELAPSRAGWRLVIQPSVKTYAVAAGERIVYRRDRRREQDWLRMPVGGISYDDAEAYARWLSASGRVPGARLCTELEWERSARGADDREFPHGDRLELDDANHDATYGKQPEAFGPDEVGSHPASRSPFGVDDLAGNVWEWTRSSFSPDERVARGGSYYYTAKSSRATNREPTEPTLRNATLGVRICADPPVPVSQRGR